MPMRVMSDPGLRRSVTSEATWSDGEEGEEAAVPLSASFPSLAPLTFARSRSRSCAANDQPRPPPANPGHKPRSPTLQLPGLLQKKTYLEFAWLSRKPSIKPPSPTLTSPIKGVPSSLIRPTLPPLVAPLPCQHSEELDEDEEEGGGIYCVSPTLFYAPAPPPRRRVAHWCDDELETRPIHVPRPPVRPANAAPSPRTPPTPSLSA